MNTRNYENRTKQCNTCKKIKSFDEFYKSGTFIHSACKECEKKYRINQANKKAKEEITRLNNIINELEKILQKGIDEIYEYTEYNKGVNATFIYILEKLQELKENS